MGSRSGDIDPGVLGYIGERLGLDLREVIAALNLPRRSASPAANTSAALATSEASTPTTTTPTWAPATPSSRLSVLGARCRGSRNGGPRREPLLPVDTHG